jgi:hypothetical protein
MLFIDRNGFGFSRMIPQLGDVLAPPKSQSDTSTARTVVEDPMAIRAGKDAKEAHFSLARAVGKASFIQSPVRGKAWLVKDVQLVGLVKNPDPVVYLTGGAAMIPGKEVKTRRPDTFEAKALEVIQGGGELVQAEKRGDTIRALSGIYAGKQCMKCHERAGEMLGAFSYLVALETPSPDVKEVGVGLPFQDFQPGLPFQK